MSSSDNQLPLDAWHRAKGARMVPFAGYDMPIQYEGIIAEHLWVRQSAGLFDVSHMGQLLVAGGGAEAALEALLPADLSTLKDGRLRYSMLLTEEGGIVDDLMVTRRGDHFYLVVNGATKESDIAWLEAGLARGVVLDHMREQALLALQGPRAAEVLDRIVPGVSKLDFMSGEAFTINGGRAWISRSGYTGEDGFEISIPATAVEALAERLTSEPEVKPIGLGARDSLRLEAGLPLYGHDVDVHVSPIEAGLGFAVARRRRAEGGFRGWHRVIKEIEEGPARKRVGLKVEGRQPVREGALVLDDEGGTVGKITSGGYSPTLEAPIAMALVPAEMAEAGTALRLSQRGRDFAGTIVSMPFVPHKYHRKGGSA